MTEIKTTSKVENGLDEMIAERLRKARKVTAIKEHTHEHITTYDALKNEMSEAAMRVCDELTVQWEITMRSQGAEVTKEDSLFAYYTFYMWQRDKVLDKPMIVSAPPAFGKTTMLLIYLRYMLRNYPETFGAIVVQERLDDIKHIAADLNLTAVQEAPHPLIKRKSKLAFAIEGYDPDKMSRDEYNAQFAKQEHYNVVLMTKEQFALQTIKDNLVNFTRFYGLDGKDRPRRTLLIDEKPRLLAHHTISSRDLNALVDDIREASHRVNGRDEPYYEKTLKHINVLRQYMEAPCEDNEIIKIEPVEPGYKLPVKLLRDFTAVHDYRKSTYLKAFERIVGHGGELQTIEGVPAITSAYALHNKFTLFNSFVLDGTADKDPEYISDDFYIFAPKDKPDYSNVTFHVCDTYSLSKTVLNNHGEKLIERLGDMIKRIVSKKDSPTLVTTYKDRTQDFKDLLSEEIESGKIIIKHFDGGRGSNAYVGADNAIYIGALAKSSTYYTTATQAVIGDRISDEINNESTLTKSGIYFKDNFVNEYRQLDMAVNMIQETNRLRASKKTQPVNIYLFSKDAEMVKHITDAYPGAKVEDFTPIERLTGKQTSEDKLINYFEQMESGHKVKGTEIYKTINISKVTFSKIQKKQRVQKAMEELGIKKEGHSFIKA